MAGPPSVVGPEQLKPGKIQAKIQAKKSPLVKAG